MVVWSSNSFLKRHSKLGLNHSKKRLRSEDLGSPSNNIFDQEPSLMAFECELRLILELDMVSLSNQKAFKNNGFSIK
jgi:hypothetical protein